MEDLLKEVIEEQEESLKKYKNKNVRTKNITFFPINNIVEAKSDISIISEINNDLNKNNKVNSSTFAENSKPVQEIKETKEIKKSEKVIEKKETETAKDFNDYISLLSTKFSKDKTLREKQVEENSKKKQTAAEKRKAIITTYMYLFDCFQNYSLCFEEFPEIISKFPQFVKGLPEVKKEPIVPNKRDFILKIRTVALIQKINILAYQIGQYNFSLIAEEIPDIDIFKEYTAEDLAIKISKKYEGSDLDYKALLTLHDIAIADMNGEIVFENIKTKTLEEKENEKETITDKKANRKKALGFDSFNLKSKK